MGSELDPVEANRRSWNVATANHNAHKGDQAAWLRGGGDTLFPEELALMGPIEGLEVAHLQCNSGQDTLCLARRGARVTGVDLSDQAVAFARDLSAASGIPATFERAEIVGWMHGTDARFDVAFASYGVLGWNADLDAWMRGAARILRPGGRLVIVEYHPLCWSLGKTLSLDGDDYFDRGPYRDPVGDYTAETMGEAPLGNHEPACSWQYTLAETVMAVLRAGFSLERLEEYPHANGCRVSPLLVEVEGKRWVPPPGRARVPLMFGLVARSEAKPSEVPVIR